MTGDIGPEEEAVDASEPRLALSKRHGRTFMGEERVVRFGNIWVSLRSPEEMLWKDMEGRGRG